MLLINPARTAETKGGVPFCLTQFELTRAATVGQFGILRVALTPIVGAYGRGLRRLDLVGFDIAETGGALLGRVVVDIGGPTGAAPTTPTAELHKLIRDAVTFPQATALHTGLTSFTGTSATPDTAVVAEADRVIDTLLPGGVTGVSAGGQDGSAGVSVIPDEALPMPFYLPQVNPHLTGWGVMVVAQTVNFVITARFSVYVREYYV